MISLVWMWICGIQDNLPLNPFFVLGDVDLTSFSHLKIKKIKHNFVFYIQIGIAQKENVHNVA